MLSWRWWWRWWRWLWWWWCCCCWWWWCWWWCWWRWRRNNACKDMLSGLVGDEGTTLTALGRPEQHHHRSPPPTSASASKSARFSISIAAIISTMECFTNQREAQSSCPLPKSSWTWMLLEKLKGPVLYVMHVNIWTFVIGGIADAHCTFLWSVQIENWSKKYFVIHINVFLWNV